MAEGAPDIVAKAIIMYACWFMVGIGVELYGVEGANGSPMLSADICNCKGVDC